MSPQRDDQQPNDEPVDDGNEDRPKVFETGEPVAEPVAEPGDADEDATGPDIFEVDDQPSADDVTIARSGDGTEVVGGSSPDTPPPDAD